MKWFCVWDDRFETAFVAINGGDGVSCVCHTAVHVLVCVDDQDLFGGVISVSESWFKP